MTDSMVERVARALTKANQPPGFPADWIDHNIDVCWPDYEKKARAAIAAMLEPTEAMIDAMIVRQEAHDRGLKGGDRDVFIAAIDEALK